MSKPISLLAMRAFDWIHAYCLANGRFPTITAIRDGLGYKSNQSVVDYLNILEKAGLIGYQPNGTKRRRYIVGMTAVMDGWRLVTTADELTAWERAYKRRQNE